MAYELPKLEYAYDALEPHLDARTMEIHHTKHHAAYVAKLNAALEQQPALQARPLEELLGDLASVPEALRTAVRNHGGGTFNHNLFWRVMAPGAGGAPGGKLAKAIDAELGGFGAFQARFTEAASGRFGSGWAWLGVKDDRTLCVCSTANQDHPIMKGVVDGGCRPILCLDVWEHAYYLHYQNRRADYIAAWWNVVHWARVGEAYDRLAG